MMENISQTTKGDNPRKIFFKVLTWRLLIRMNNNAGRKNKKLSMRFSVAKPLIRLIKKIVLLSKKFSSVLSRKSSTKLASKRCVAGFSSPEVEKSTKAFEKIRIA